jgi:hypothetical protein
MELLKRYWIIIAVAVAVGWWWVRRRSAAKEAGADATVTGQPMFSSAVIPKITTEPMATQGTQILGSRQTPVMWDVIGRSRGVPVDTSMTLAPRTLMDKAASMPLAIAGAVTGGGLTGGASAMTRAVVGISSPSTRPLAFGSSTGLRA